MGVIGPPKGLLELLQNGRAGLLISPHKGRAPRFREAPLGRRDSYLDMCAEEFLR